MGTKWVHEKGILYAFLIKKENRCMGPKIAGLDWPHCIILIYTTIQKKLVSCLSKLFVVSLINIIQWWHLQLHIDPFYLLSFSDKFIKTYFGSCQNIINEQL